ncbi:hypothetical protein HYV43_02310 [Candidatus Micrarchaeota archaeon]|nr:hypothetical protein [Candidatus Micrarchaeota archaeon]
MGRIKGRHIKTAANALIKHYEAQLSADFEQNKLVVRQLNLLPGSKKERMKLAGEVTSIMARRAPKPASVAAVKPQANP